MRRRVRWDNVIRVAGAALIVGLVVAWPRLAPPEPEVPAPEPAPLAGDEGEEPLPVSPLEVRREPAGDREVRESADGRDRDPRARRRKASRGQEQAATQGERAGRVRRDPAARPRPVPAATPQPTPPVDRPRSAPSPDQDPAQTEFGFESG